MLLATIVDQITTECDLDTTTIGLYRRATRRFSEFIGNPATDEDLNRENLNRFIQSMQGVLSNTTASNYRRALCRIWNYLTETESKPAYEIRRLRRPKTIERPVVSWMPDEIVAVMKSVDSLNGCLKLGLPANALFKALIWTAYDTGLRPSDLFRLRWEQLDWEKKSIILVQNKTQKAHVVFLREESIVALKEIRKPERDLIFPLTWGCVRRWMEKIFSGAKQHGFVRARGRNLGTLRKSNATQIYISHGESAAAESLGHTSGTRIVRKHYIDHRALRQYSVPAHPNGVGT